MKLYSWNVNGIRAVINKGEFSKFIETHDPDILCLQETKASRDQVEIDLPQYHEHFFSAVKKGYSGTAIFSKMPAIQYLDGFPEDIIKTYDASGDLYGDPNKEGRVIAAEIEKLWVVTVYTPNSKGDLSRIELRHKHWDPAFLAYVKALEAGKYSKNLKLERDNSDTSQGSDEHAHEAVPKSTANSHAQSLTQRGTESSRAGKPVLFCGDLNVAHQEIDLANPKPNIGKHGFTDEERQGFQNFLEAGFVDVFRATYPDKTAAYTWWTHWANARARNVGWRIDYWLASKDIAEMVRNPQIHADQTGSDHCPVSIDI